MLWSTVLLLGGFCLSVTRAESGNIRPLEAIDNVPKTEIDALYVLYNSTGGENWSWPPERNISGLTPWQRGGPWVFSQDANPCADNWYGIKCTDIPPRHVEFIILPAQNLSGTLPSDIGNFPALQKIEFRHNPNLTGTIPDVFGNVKSLQGFDMSHNSLNGTLPASLLASASTLESLVVYRNLLSGSFPTFLCELTYLQALNLANNSMHGKLPDCIGQLTRLRGMTMSVNQFTGQLPQTLGNMTNIKEISFDTNDFTGPIPESIGNLEHLEYFGVYFTNMSGQVPDSICKMQRLKALLSFNSLFNGTIPHCLSNMSALTTYDANGNYFTGTIPASLLAKEGLHDLAIRDSAVEGTLPSLLASSLQTLEFGGNKLHGTLPAGIFALRNLRVLEVYDNRLTGPLPASIKDAKSLTTLHMGQNHFTGPIPSDIGNCSQLGYVLLNNNFMTGTLPRSLARLALLVELDVEANYFSGSIAGTIDSNVHIALKTLILNNNRFTGQIPDDLFRLRALTVFAAVSNCFQTQLTDAMCKSDSLVTLAMDGLKSGATCRAELLHGLTSAYAVEHALTQKIPDCLFQMKSLTTLHLSGNGLTGQLPSNITISRALVALSLSHNELRGVIPQNFQTKSWATLDLSYNRLTGTLFESFARDDQYGNLTSTHVDLSLENNRLSGRVPRVLLKAREISILGSNIFTCNAQRTDLPEKDQGLKNYHCASRSFDVPYYLWLALSVFCAGLISLLVFSKGATKVGARLLAVKHRATAALALMHDTGIESQTSALRAAVELYHHVCILAGLCACFMLLALVPFYFAAANLYGTFYHQYAWQVSAALLSGSVAAAVLMTLLFLLLCIFAGAAYFRARRSRLAADVKRGNRLSRPISTSSVVVGATVLLSWCERFIVYTLFLILSVSVVVGVNISYVVVLLNYDSNTVVAVQVLLAFFKLFWNNFCSKNLLRWTGRQISKSAEATESAYGGEFHFVQLLVSLINNIAIPCIVVAVISPNCLYNVFVPAPVVDASYEYDSCVLNFRNRTCISTYQETAVGYTSYHPPFVYSYQCSSSIVTYYAPAFVFLCITATFVTPFSQFVAMRAARDERLPQWIRDALRYCVPKILAPLDLTEASTSADPTTQSPYFDANRAAILLFSYLGMLMTFGAVFPPLAVALAVTILSTTFFIKLKIGNFLTSAIEQKAVQLVNVLNAECKQLAQMSALAPSVWLIVTFSCWFYTLFLFDTLGDAVGFRKAYWVLIVMPLMPVCLYTLYYTIVWWIEKNDGKLEQSFVSESTLSPLSRQGSSSAQVELSDVYSRSSESL